MWFVPNVDPGPAAPSGQTTAQAARQRIRTERLEPDERAAIAEVFEVLEDLVIADELPAEARGVYDATVLRLVGYPARDAA